MVGTFTVDASVFLNAFNPYEAGYAESHRLLAELQGQALPIIVPTLLLTEAAAAVALGRPVTEANWSIYHPIGRRNARPRLGGT